MRPNIKNVTIGVMNNKNSEIAIDTLDYFSYIKFSMTTHITYLTPFGGNISLSLMKNIFVFCLILRYIFLIPYVHNMLIFVSGLI